MNTPFKLNNSYVKSFKLISFLFLLLIIIAIPLTVLSTQLQTQTRQDAAQQQNPIQLENQLPGTTNWQLTNPANYKTNQRRSPDIEGYAWQSSAAAGDTIHFSVSTTQKSFGVDVYRLGWYQGKGGRLITSIPSVSGSFYAMPSLDSQTGLIEAQWPTSFSLTIAPSWTTGAYLIKLTASNGIQSYIPFVVRSTQKSDFAFIHSVNTDEAYNYWGGVSLYNDFTHTLQAKRAFKVSFDRPFVQVYGAGYLLVWEYPMIRYLEQKGYNLGYLSDTDVSTSSNLIQSLPGIILVGHNEYWTKQMRDNLESAVNSGVSFADFASDSSYWQIRYEPQIFGSNPLRNRIITCYKNATLDPLTGKDNSQVTVNFRDPPVNRPEQSLLGSMFENYWKSTLPGADFVITNASSWVFAGTGLKNGDVIPGITGFEYDKVLANYPIPQGTIILSSSPVVDYTGHHDISNATLYTAPSGARVFNAGTIEWAWGVDNYVSPWYVQHSLLMNSDSQKITDNILQNFLSNTQTTVTPTPILSPIPTVVSSQNYLLNPSFETWYAPWKWNPQGTTAIGSWNQDCSTATDGKCSAHISVTTADPKHPWYIEFYQPWVTLIPGKNTTISFYAKSPNGGQFHVILSHYGRPYTTYYNQIPALTSNWTHYTYTFTNSSINDANALFALDFAGAVGDTWLDNVVVTTDN